MVQTEGESKHCLKDDFKIIAQAINERATELITADVRLINRMTNSDFDLGFHFINLNQPLTDYLGEFPFED